jgi:hypothetical protein
VAQTKSSLYYCLPDKIALTYDEANAIKKLRCGEIMHSWRSVARYFTRANKEFVLKYDLLVMADGDYEIERYGSLMDADEIAAYTKWESGNQLLGIDLCRAAMLFFDEKDEDGWN